MVFSEVREQEVHPRAASLEYHEPAHLKRIRIDLYDKLSELFRRSLREESEQAIACDDRGFIG